MLIKQLTEKEANQANMLISQLKVTLKKRAQHLSAAFVNSETSMFVNTKKVKKSELKHLQLVTSSMKLAYLKVKDSKVLSSAITKPVDQCHMVLISIDHLVQ